MIRDPFYRQIIDGLDGRLDPEDFERCACDLLRRSAWPTLVPIRGGTDAGMDGGIADGEGTPFPLVCTTRKDVLGNLTGSLKSYEKGGGARLKVVLATSQALTPKRRSNLEKRAQDLGFQLIQIHEQAAMADLLYRDPAWCRELLALTGDPPALSVVPGSTRPLLGNTLVGREPDVAWVTETAGDRLLVGQPASGKTSLLHAWAKAEGGLFVVCDDPGAIAAAIRVEQPTALIIDDAHTKPALVASLRHLRQAISASFDVVATCWEGQQDGVVEALGIPQSQAHRLDRLTRDEIVQVIRGAGLDGPTELVREIVNQAEGRPGLAVTLASFALRGDARAVALGDLLARSVRTTLEPIVGREVSMILAAFAIGGDAGMTQADVAQGLEMPIYRVRDAVTALAAAGVILEVNETHLSVRPATLRWALVRDVFFCGPQSLPAEFLLATAPNPTEVANTLMGAKARGGNLPPDLLLGFLERAHSADAWAGYASLGEAEAQDVLRLHPEMIVSVAWAVLRWAPAMAIPLLLEKAIGDHRDLPSTPEHPLRKIKDWVESAIPGTGEGVVDREILLDATSAWLATGGDDTVAVRALSLVISPAHHRATSDPGSGMQINLHFGLLTLDELCEIRRLWPRVLEVITRMERPVLNPLLQAIGGWAYPGRYQGGMPEEMYATMQATASQMVADLVPLNADRPGVLHRLRKLAESLPCALEIELSEEFAILYPEDWSQGNWQAEEARQRAAVRDLAARVVDQPPTDVLRRIGDAESEAAAAGINWPRWTPLLCHEIASLTSSPLAWARDAIAADISAELVSPFLAKAAEIGEAGWEDVATRCLDEPDLCGLAIWTILTAPTVSDVLLDRAVAETGMLLRAVQFWSAEIPEDRFRRLLSHKDARVAGAAAVGEWLTEPRGVIRPSLEILWRQAALRIDREEYWLGEILRADPSLAADWLVAHVTRDERISIELPRPVEAAISVIDVAGRERVLIAIPQDFPDTELLCRLVGDDPDLYQLLLSRKVNDLLHLAPLKGQPTGSWIAKARLALDAGYRPEKVADAVVGWHSSWSGKLSNFYRQHRDWFEPLCDHEEPRIRQVGQAGRRRAEEVLTHELERERHEEVFGRQ